MLYKANNLIPRILGKRKNRKRKGLRREVRYWKGGKGERRRNCHEASKIPQQVNELAVKRGDVNLLNPHNSEKRMYSTKASTDHL